MTLAVDLLTITDGRGQLLERSIAAAREQLRGAWFTCWLYDDSGDPAYRAWLVDRFPEFEVFWHPAGRQGFGGAIRYAWQHLRDHASGAAIFHLEDDFVLTRRVDVDDMAEVLRADPCLAQLALRRQPWNDAERAAGGIVEQHQADFVEVRNVRGSWLQHRRFFTTNPSLYPRRLILEHDWPDGPESEGRFGLELWRAGWFAGYWGARDSGEWCEHIGAERVGTGY